MVDEQTPPEQPAGQDEPQIWFRDSQVTGPATTYQRMYDIVDGNEVNRLVIFETSVQLDPIGGVHLHVSEGLDLQPFLDKGVLFAQATRAQVAAACLRWEMQEYENFQLRVREMVQQKMMQAHGMQAAAAAAAGRIVRPDGSPFGPRQ